MLGFNGIRVTTHQLPSAAEDENLRPVCKGIVSVGLEFGKPAFLRQIGGALRNVISELAMPDLCMPWQNSCFHQSALEITPFQVPYHVVITWLFP